MYHGINKARDVIQVSSGSKEGMGLLDKFRYCYKKLYHFMRKFQNSSKFMIYTNTLMGRLYYCFEKWK